MALAPSVLVRVALTDIAVAVGRVEGEAGAVEVDVDRAQAQRDAVEDLRQRVGDDVALGGCGVEEERVADDDGAEVEGAGDRRGDDGEAQRGAFVGAGEVGLAVGVEGVGAGAGADGDGADARGGAARVGLLGRSGLARRGGDRGAQEQAGMPASFAESPGAG